MDIHEAISKTWWTTNMAETQALGSTTDEEVAGFFYCTMSIPRMQWSDPGGPRNYNIRVPRWISSQADPETGQRPLIENEAYLLIVAEIEKRKAA